MLTLQFLSALAPFYLLPAPVLSLPSTPRVHLETLQLRDAAPSNVTRNNKLTFSNPATQAFHVDGSNIPHVPFDAGDSWAGLLPISDSMDETRELFFWLWPGKGDLGSDDLIIWLNGGPGCSSLEGFLQGNGPISWQPGQLGPTPNPYSWTNVSNMIWIEQPVGTGFSQGTPNITNEVDLADQFTGFLKQFFSTFEELQNKKLWMTGESYAGMYIPYIADFIYNQPQLKDAGLNLQGTLIFDGSLSWDVVTAEIPTFPFVQKWNNVLNLNASFITQLEEINNKCGYADYSAKYITYPPKGPLPLPPGGTNITDECDIFNSALNAASLVNPCFNIYHVLDTCPTPYDPEGIAGDAFRPNGPVFFQDPAVQDALHVPRTNWSSCDEHNVFLKDGDTSDPPGPAGVLTRVIDNNTRTLIGHGLLDAVLFSEGARIMIQNLTFGGKQGFQTPINTPLIIEGLGEMGVWHEERKLLYAEYALSGHKVPEYQPLSAYKSIKWLLGQISSLNDPL